jgi:hypothetical protein
MQDSAELRALLTPEQLMVLEKLNGTALDMSEAAMQVVGE